MASDDTERFIKQAARSGWSRTAVCEVLGISWFSLNAILEVMPPLEWVSGYRSAARRRDWESRRGEFTPVLQRGLQTAVANKRKRAEHEAFGVRGTIKELAKHFGVGASTVRRRMAEGLTLEAALTVPVTPPHLRRRISLTELAQLASPQQQTALGDSEP